MDWFSLDVNAEGILDRVDFKLQFTEIILNATLKIKQGTNKEREIKLIHKAKQNCLFTNSIKTNVVLNAKILFVNIINPNNA